jgi:hypothetical protein
MEHLTIDASPTQLRKLKKGQKVRIKKGTGFNLLVHPETYKRVSRSFGKNKGTELALTQAELDANTVVSPEQHAQLQRVNPEGRGIFGSKFDNFMSKTLGDNVYGAIYKGADEFKPHVKTAIKAGLTTAGAMATPFVATYAPMLAPMIPAAVAGASQLADDYIEDPEKYQKQFRKTTQQARQTYDKYKQPRMRQPVYYDEEEYTPPPRSGLRGRKPRSIYEQADIVRGDEQLNHVLGTNYNYMGRAGMQQALADTIRKKISDEQIGSRLNLRPRNMSSGPRSAMSDFYAPEPQQLSRSFDSFRGMMGNGISREAGTVGLKGGMIHSYTPQAMESQPFGINFQMQHFLPPQYQKYNAGTTQEGMVGTGVKSHPDHVMTHLPPALQSQPMGANFMMKNFLPVQFQDMYQTNPVMMGQGLYAGKGLYA